MENSDSESKSQIEKNDSSTATDGTNIPKVTVKFDGSNWQNQVTDDTASETASNTAGKFDIYN